MPEQTDRYASTMGVLYALADPRWRDGSQARFGIATARALGIPVPALRKLAKEIGRDHTLAGQLWDSGVHEARILATLLADSALVTEAQMEAWVRDLDSWDVCDHCCGNLWVHTPYAYSKASEWSGRGEEFVKRAGFALMAYLAMRDKRAGDGRMLPFLSIIKREAHDGRNFVKKAANWALREIGKRSPTMHRAAVACALEISEQGTGSARWIAADALRELQGERVLGTMRRIESR